MDGMGWVPDFLLFLLLPAIFFAGIIFLAVFLIGSSKGTQADPRAALAILEERYARGEIGREEFLDRRAVLRGQPKA